MKVDAKKTKFLEVAPKGGAEKALEDGFEEEIKRVLRIMFERSGLYQNHNVAAPKDYADLPFRINSGKTGVSPIGSITFRAPSVELLCDKCKRKSLFASRSASNDYETQRKNQVEQWFSITYVCDACDESAIGYQVRRVGLKLQLTGRTSAYRPSVSACWGSVSEIASNAVAAVSEGDISAGYYHLRTAIEQDMKSRCGLPVEDKIEGTKLCDQYNETLESEFKNRFPAFSTLYATLSAGMHSRKVTIEEFNQLFKDAEDHLAGRRTFDNHPKKTP